MRGRQAAHGGVAAVVVERGGGLIARYRGISGYRVSDMEKFFGLTRCREKFGLDIGAEG